MQRQAFLEADGLSHSAVPPVSDIQARRLEGRSEWDALFQRAEQPHLTQAWLYGEAKRASAGWGVTRLVFERAGKPLAICQVLEKRVLRLPLLHPINRGPLFLGGAPSA